MRATPTSASQNVFEVGPAVALADMGHGRKSLTKVVRQVAPAVCGRNAHDLQLVTDSVETEFR